MWEGPESLHFCVSRAHPRRCPWNCAPRGRACTAGPLQEVLPSRSVGGVCGSLWKALGMRQSPWTSSGLWRKVPQGPALGWLHRHLHQLPIRACDLCRVLAHVLMMLMGPVASIKSHTGTRCYFCSKDIQWKCQGVQILFPNFLWVFSWWVSPVENPVTRHQEVPPSTL